MSKTRISIDQINERLGTKSGPQGKANFIDEEPKEASGVSSGVFLSATAGSCIVLGMAAFMFFGSEVSLPTFQSETDSKTFVSSADRTCSSLRRPDRANVEYLHCILTVDQKRLCDPREKEFIAIAIKNYRLEFQASYAKLNAMAFASENPQLAAAAKIAATIGPIMQEMSEAEKQPGGLSKEQKERFQKRISAFESEMQASALAPNTRFDKVVTHNKFVEQNKKDEVKLAVTLRKLIESGYISRDDFGWTFDSIVKLAMKDAQTPKNDPCLG